jgi:hypothetical protein
MAIERDAWLYGNKQTRAKITKAAIQAKGQLEPASEAVFEYLSESPKERATRTRITNWGVSKGEAVSVVKAKGGIGGADAPTPSKQLRDPFTTFYVQGIALEPPLPPERLLNLTEENALHSACLNAKAIDACGRGWTFEPPEGQQGDSSLSESDLPKQLAKAMEDLTPDLTFTELLYQAAWEMDAIGWGVWEVVRKDNDGAPGKHGKIDAIYPIPSHTIRASLDPRKWVQIRAGRVRYFKLFGAECTINNETGEVFEWEKAGDDRKKADSMNEAYVASELIIFKTYTPRSLWYGLPRWVSSIATIAELGAIREFNVSWFASGGQVDYHMHFTAATQEGAQVLKDQVEQQIREFAGRGHTNVLTAGPDDTKVTVSKLGDLLREGHFRIRRTDLIKEVLIAHQVPPYRVGWADTGALGGNAADEMLGAYSLGAVAPIQRVIEDRLRTTLFDPILGIKTDEFRLKLKKLELEDVKSELSIVTGGVESGWMTPAQAREHMDLAPDKDAPELNNYYYKGTKLGDTPAAPGGAHPGGGFPPNVGPGQQPGAPPQPGGGFGSFDDKPQPGQPPNPAQAAKAAAKEAFLEMARDFEAKHAAALLDTDPIDSPQPPKGKKPRRDTPATVTGTGPARGDIPVV